MSKADHNTEIPVETIETITTDDLVSQLNEPVSFTIDTTLYGFITVLAAMQDLSGKEMEKGNIVEALELLALVGRIEDAHADTEAKFSELNEFIMDDRVTGEPTDSPSLLPARTE